jgi:predicted amidophosphoribosyltransferase
MTLITCPECAAEISSHAEACPHCGVPIAKVRETEEASERLQTIQQISKKLKLHNLISLSLLFSGIAGASVLRSLAKSGRPASSEVVAIVALLVLVGGVWYLVTRIRVWRHHIRVP